MRVLIAALLLGAIIAVPAAAGAQTDHKPPEAGATEATPEAQASDNKARAKAAFLGARAAYKAQHFQEALDGFQAAYALDPRPEMLFNIGLCQHKLGKLETARDTYGKFLEERPDTKARPKVEQKIAEIDATLKKPYELQEDKPPGGDAPGTPQDPPQPSVAPRVYKRTGLQVFADLGISALTSNISSTTGSTYLQFTPSAGVGVGVLHRPLSWLAYGARLTWAAQGITVNDSTVSSATAWFFDGSGLVEFYPLAPFLGWSRFDPYIGLGMGYGQITVDTDKYSFIARGATLHINTGVNLFVTRWIGVGGFIRYMHGIWTEACGSDGCFSIENVDQDVKDSLPGMFLIGAEGAFHFL